MPLKNPPKQAPWGEVWGDGGEKTAGGKKEEGSEVGGWAIFNFSWLLARATAINLVQMRREVGQKERMLPVRGEAGNKRGWLLFLVPFSHLHLQTEHEANIILNTLCFGWLSRGRRGERRRFALWYHTDPEPGPRDSKGLNCLPCCLQTALPAWLKKGTDCQAAIADKMKQARHPSPCYSR